MTSEESKAAAEETKTAATEGISETAAPAAPKRRGRPPKAKTAAAGAAKESAPKTRKKAAAAVVQPELPVVAAEAVKEETVKAEPVKEESKPVAAETNPRALVADAAPAVFNATPAAQPQEQQNQQAQQPVQGQAQGQNGQQQGQTRQMSRREQKRLAWLQQRAQRMGQGGGVRQQHPQHQQHQQQFPRPQQQPPPVQTRVQRNPELPEYRLSDIHGWDNAEIVEKMMPNANAEDLGAMRRHDIIFEAIRSYLARGGAVMASGCLEVVKEGYGFLRSAKTNFLACPEDVFIPQQQVRRHALRTGDSVEGPIRDPRERQRFFALESVVKVNGKTPSEAARIVHFENLKPTFPTRRIVLETEQDEVSTRMVDMFTPIGFGQRGLIVAPPRVGKTVLLQKIANAITKNHPEAMLIVLLIDERPEEVTDMQRNTKALVLSSTFDEEPQHHVNVADMVIEMSRRQVENGRDVIILLDSITRLARAYNTVQPHSGKILTGGVDALALHRPKRFFGAARNIEGGGSLTILATALIDTGSRMDEVIFEEFKGTGNMELVLDRFLADRRIFPAIDVNKSGTRKEDLLLDRLELEKTWSLRRAISEMPPERAVQTVTALMQKYKTNPEMLMSISLE